MIYSYWDLYLAYVRQCEAYNKKHDIDPHHYEMEWNHDLPQSLFKGHGPGQYLLLRQHAIASALQTLAFKQSCLCGWHKKYLPEWLAELAWPYFQQHKKEIGYASFSKKKGCHAPGIAGTGAQRAKELRVGALFATSEELSEWGKLGGSRGGRSGLNADTVYVKERSKRAGKKAATTLWEDPEHPELGQQNAGNLVKMQRKRGLPSGRENRVKVSIKGN